MFCGAWKSIHIMILLLHHVLQKQKHAQLINLRNAVVKINLWIETYWNMLK